MSAPIIGTLPRSIRTVEELESVQAAFEAFVASKPSPAAFEEALERYIDTIDLLPDCEPRSLGMQWLESNLKTFAQLTDNADPSDFLLRCITSDFIGNVLYHKELLLMIPVGNRPGFVAEIIREQCPFGYDWIPVVKEVCELNIGELIFLRLLGAHPESWLFRDFTVTSRNGKVIWSLFDRFQFTLAVHAVGQKKPELLFEAGSSSFRQRAETRLENEWNDGGEQFTTLLAAAAKELTSLEDVSYSVFKRLPVEVQHKLLLQIAREEMRCSILFLAELAADKNHFDKWFKPFLNACIRVKRTPESSYEPPFFEYTVSIAEYVELRKLCKRIKRENTKAGHPERNGDLLQNIDDTYRAILEREKGVYFGTLVESTYPKRKRSGGTVMTTQLIVRINAFKHPPFDYEYVDHSAPTLQAGDLVAFGRWSGERIYRDSRKTVSKTRFTLIERAQVTPKPGPGPRR